MTEEQNVSFALESDASNYGVPSPPHSLSISAHSATYVRISWQPPEFTHLHESIVYQYVVKQLVADNLSNSFFQLGMEMC